METLKINPASLQSPSAGRNTSKAIISRGIQALFSAYRRDDFADPEGFVAQLGTILTEFPDEVVNYITSPNTGLQRRSKWPPTISEVLTACEEHQAFLIKTRTVRPVLIKERLAPLLHERPQGYLATIFVPEGHVRYAKLVEWTNEAKPIWWKFGKASDGRNGLWVSRGAWEGIPETENFYLGKAAAPPITECKAPSWDHITKAYADDPSRLERLVNAADDQHPEPSE